jgi:hypothetical protein
MQNRYSIKTNKKHFTLWRASIYSALLGILSYKTTRSALISEVLFLVLFSWVVIKVLSSILRISSFLLKVLVIAIVLLLWINVLFDH